MLKYNFEKRIQPSFKIEVTKQVKIKSCLFDLRKKTRPVKDNQFSERSINIQRLSFSLQILTTVEVILVSMVVRVMIESMAIHVHVKTDSMVLTVRQVVKLLKLSYISLFRNNESIVVFKVH